MAYISSRFNTTSNRLDALACSTLSNRQLDGKHFLVQKQQHRFSLILRGSRHPAVNCQISQKLLHLTSAQVARMPQLAKMKYIAFNPVSLGLFSANTVMFLTDFGPHLIEQFRWVFPWWS
jgi:hypothetical protein